MIFDPNDYDIIYNIDQDHDTLRPELNQRVFDHLTKYN